MFRTGELLRLGFDDGKTTIEKDPAEAIKFYETAFQKSTDNREKRKACQELVNIYKKEGPEQNFFKAKHWLEGGEKLGSLSLETDYGYTIIIKGKK